MNKSEKNRVLWWLKDAYEDLCTDPGGHHRYILKDDLRGLAIVMEWHRYPGEWDRDIQGYRRDDKGQLYVDKDYLPTLRNLPSFGSSESLYRLRLVEWWRDCGGKEGEGLFIGLRRIASDGETLTEIEGKGISDTPILGQKDIGDVLRRLGYALENLFSKL